MGPLVGQFIGLFFCWRCRIRANTPLVAMLNTTLVTTPFTQKLQLQFQMKHTKSLKLFCLYLLFSLPYPSVKVDTYNEVLNAIKSLRNDCSTGPFQIPTKFIKPIDEFLASPLCHIINTCSHMSAFQTKLKTARISPIPKVDDPRANDDYRPVSILPVLLKIFERLVMNQIVDFIQKDKILNEKVCGYRKGHSTVTALLGIKDMIVQALGRDEITLTVLADFSKAFDTIDY